MDINVKKCSKCQEIKSIDLFGVKKHNKDGLNHYCKVCENNRGVIVTIVATHNCVSWCKTSRCFNDYN